MRYELIEHPGFTCTEYVEASNSVTEQLAAMESAKRAERPGGFVVAPMPNERAGSIVVMVGANLSSVTLPSVRFEALFSLVASTQAHEFRDVGDVPTGRKRRSTT